MSLPTNIDLPLRVDYQDKEDMDRYLRDLVNELQDMYGKIAENVNGNIRNYADINHDKWVPTLSAAAGVTFTYTHQYGWSIRQGLFTEVWFDIGWSAVSALSGNVSVVLPYKVIPSSGRPFVGTLIPANWNYTGNLTFYINALPESYLGEIWGSRDVGAAAAAGVQNSGRFYGHLRYIGIEDE